MAIEKIPILNANTNDTVYPETSYDQVKGGSPDTVFGYDASSNPILIPKSELGGSGGSGGSGGNKYVLLTQDSGSNPYRVPDNYKFVNWKLSSTSSYSEDALTSYSLSQNATLKRGQNKNIPPNTLHFDSNGDLRLTSTGPAYYFAVVELIEIEGT